MAVGGGLLALTAALLMVQTALRIVVEHSGLYFDVFIAKMLEQDLSGTTAGLVAAGGAPVGWRMAPFSGEITLDWAVHEGSELLLLGAAPFLAAAVLGWFAAVVSDRLALSRWLLLGASGGVYLVVLGGLWAAARTSVAGTGVELTTSMSWALATAAGWVLVVGGAVVRFYRPRVAQGSDRSVAAARRRVVRHLAVATAVGLLGSLVSAGTAAASPAKADVQPWRAEGVDDAVAALKRESGGKPLIANDAERGVPSMMGELRSKVGSGGVSGWLDAHAKVFGVTSLKGKLKKDTERVEVKDKTGGRHRWYDQTVDGVPVYGARLGVHLDRAGGTVTAVSNGFRPDLMPLPSTDPVVTAKSAVKTAAAALPGGRSRKAPSLVVYAAAAHKGSRARAALAWQVDLMGQDGTSGRYFVDALHPGRIAGYQPTTETGLSRVIFDREHGTEDDSPRKLVRAEGDGPANDKDADDAYDQLGYVYGYFWNTFGRDAIDDNGGDLISHVHYGKNYQNAFWNGSYMTYGDGMLSQDVTGHEMTHGITQRTAGLVYSFQSGALNESISDYFGEMTEYYRKGSNDWLIGSDLTAVKPARSMADPHAYGDPQTMKEYVKTCIDNGGVHTNSGIPNYAFYRLATGIGRTPTAKILYQAMSQYLTPYSTFRDFYSAMVTSAVDLYGVHSIWTSAVSSILKSVGIDLNTPDPRIEGCGSTTIVCSTVDTLYTNADALKANGARLEDVAGSLIHMYNEGVINPSPALTYYENLYMENRSEVEGTVELQGPLLDQFVQTVQTWEPVLDAFGTPEQGNVIVTQEEIDSANAFADALVVAANDQGKPELAQLVTEERGKFDPQPAVGMNLIDAQTYMDDVVENFEKEENTPGPAAPSLASTFDNVAVTADNDTSPGNIDGGGASFSAKALSDAGVTAGSTVADSGVALSWPSTSGSGKADNTLADGQTIALNGTGNTLGFLVSATYGPVGGTGRVYYSDGSSQPFALSSPDWFGGDGEVAVTTAYQNRQDNQTYAHPAYVYYVGVPLQGGKTPVSVQLPKVSSPVVKTVPALHVFAMGLGDTAPSLASTFNSVAVTQDDSTDVGDIDGGGSSFSAQALSDAGITAGSTVGHAGLSFTWPSEAGKTETEGTLTFGGLDNTLASGQTVALDGTRGNTLGFLVTGSYGPATGTGKVNYSDGSTQSFTLSGPDWSGGEGEVAVTTAYQNRQGNQRYAQPAYVYYVGVPLQAGKTPVSVQLPDVSSTAEKGAAALHVFSMTRG